MPELTLKKKPFLKAGSKEKLSVNSATQSRKFPFFPFVYKAFLLSKPRFF